ncbi:hypothetical protein GCM10027418_21100 [Mariniluteicoccus endophyticus]
MAEDLVAGAHGEDHRAAVGGTVEAAVFGELADGRRLGAVLASAEQEDVSRVGQRLAGLDGRQGGVDAAPQGPLEQNLRVALIAVDAEQRLVDEDDLEAHARPPILRSFWNGV